MTPRYGSKHGTKTEAVIRLLRRSSGLTAIDAFSIGETHLAGTIHRLRLAGMSIETEWRTGRSRYSQRPVKFKLYRIAH
jgi:hypothetical protein